MTARIAVALAMLAPLGMLTGMAFPIGMGLAAHRVPTMTPWLWGINGATSVCASVLGVAISLVHGIGTAFAIGVAFYALAIVAYLWMGRRTGPPDGLDHQTESARFDIHRSGPTHVAAQKFSAT